MLCSLTLTGYEEREEAKPRWQLGKRLQSLPERLSSLGFSEDPFSLSFLRAKQGLLAGRGFLTYNRLYAFRKSAFHIDYQDIPQPLPQRPGFCEQDRAMQITGKTYWIAMIFQ